MLKYKFRVKSTNFDQNELVWREKYLSPDLSFISGVTSIDYHLEDYNSIVVRNDRYGVQSGNKITSENVTRQGYIVVRKKPYNIITGETTLYKTNFYDYASGEEEHYGETVDDGKEYKCVFINGKYFYEIESNEHGKCFMITNFLVEQGGRPVEKTIYSSDVEGESFCCMMSDDSKLLLDTIYWIEDGLVNIDGNTYIFDPNEGENGSLRYFENGAPLRLRKDPQTGESNEIVPTAEEIILHPYSNKDYEEVCKFTIFSKPYDTCLFDGISCCNYYYYVSFKDNYLKVREYNSSESSTSIVYEEGEELVTPMFVCEIPQYILDPFERKEILLNPLLYPIRTYKVNSDDAKILTRDEAKKINIFDSQDLYKVYSFIIIEDAVKEVVHDIQNSNSGNKVIVYLANNDDSGVRINDEILFYDKGGTRHEEDVYDLGDYDGESGDTFVFYNGKKYKIIENLCDMAVVPISALTSTQNDYSIEQKLQIGLCKEFPIFYINGKESGKDALVDYYGEIIPMRLKQDENNPQKWQVRKYGMSTVDTCGDGNVRVSDILYDINPHDGILVNKTACILKYYVDSKEIKTKKEFERLKTDQPNSIFSTTAIINEEKDILFTVEDRVGSSMLICSPVIPNNLTRSFTSYMSKLMASEVTINQNDMTLTVKNKVFGDEEITEDLGWNYRFHNETVEDSMAWFYEVKYNPQILISNSFITIPLNLNVNYANNIIQDDIVEDKFYKAEKEKSINGIVDMEKDVYTPAYIAGYYNLDNTPHYYDVNEKNRLYKGSSTIFNPIYEINLIFHFRTRNLNNWKVNDGYNSADSLSAGTDNWFVTDFHPYKEILNRTSISEKIRKEKVKLMNSSDLMGLLDFTYEDIFYQKSKVAKSFARLSLFDSIDPQVQSLLDTASVYVDEHSLYKKLIDNSRKNINIFGVVKDVDMRFSADTQGHITSSDKAIPNVTYKIDVMTEYLGENKEATREIIIDNYYENWKGVIFDESHRLSSKLTIRNKYQTDTSSEGFYHYIFREYSENLHPKPIYMKIEFNHAGIGQTIPMLVPMKWESGDTIPESSTTSDFANLKMFPNSALTLSSSGDVETLKEGIPLSYLYAQTYIPFYAVYDFVRKQYVYVIDERYLTDTNKTELYKHGILNIDLFEMKIMNEVIKEDEESEIKDPRKQKVGRININETMFPINYFNQ